ncbi:MAG: carbamoyltransferase [Aureispira sp.]|nr:carbamoyltransferase [Aureispira sp.]
MKILGISAYFHDSSATLIENGKILAAVQEERFTRKKNDSEFPINSIQFCLTETNTEWSALDQIIFYDKPFLKFERILESFYDQVPRGLGAFIKIMPVWLKKKLFLKSTIQKQLVELNPAHKKKIQTIPILFSEHHLSHAASTFFVSPFSKAAILTIDSMGEWATASISLGTENKIKVLKEMHYPNSIGLFYSAVTAFLGFRVNNGEYKVMGLAPYGRENDAQTLSFVKQLSEKVIQIYNDGSIQLNSKYFNLNSLSSLLRIKDWESLLGIAQREKEATLEQKHCNLAKAVQIVLEKIVLNLAKETKKITNCDYLCMAGGVALNSVANGKLLDSGLFKDIFIQPAAGDAGGSLGAALAAYHIYFGKKRTIHPLDAMQGALLGPSYSKEAIYTMIHSQGIQNYEYIDDFETVCTLVAQQLSQQKIVGWMQGRLEFGPRALGNRSILADPRNSEAQEIINRKIKNRESFRPFAPSVLEEDTEQYFDLKGASPYMLQVHPVAPKQLTDIPENFEQLSMSERLYFVKSTIPAVTHVDFSARIQTVSKERNERYWKVINHFKKLTGCAVVLNTSMNVRGEPIVCSPLDAYNCFLQTKMDILVIGNFIFKKTL